MNSPRLRAGLLALIALTACAPHATGAASPTFPQHRGFGDGGPAALVAGLIVSEGGCLMIEPNPPNGPRTLIVWPATYRPINGVQGAEGDGVVVHVGDEVLFGGGGTPTRRG